MSEAAEPLASRAVAGIGKLTWSEENEGWTGRVEMSGKMVGLTLLCDLKAPTREEKLAILDTANRAAEQLAQLRQVEPQWRRRAAEEIAEAAGEQTSMQAVQANMGRGEEFAAALELDEISLHGSGALYYYDSSGKFFPEDETITLFFSEDMSYEDVE